MQNMNVVLYARVSKEERTKGYSLRQQFEALRDHAAREGHEVVEECVDPGYPGDTLVRPGLDRARDLVEEGRASLVLAQDADRISREPMHRMVLDEEAARKGSQVGGAGRLGRREPRGATAAVFAGLDIEGGALKTAERTRRGSIRKVREGKLIRSRRPNYGFRYVGEKGDAYEVDEERMAVVRRIFWLVAGGATLYAIKRALEAEGVPGATGPGWDPSQIRRIVEAEVYRPHTVEGLRALGVREGVLAALDPDAVYGVWFYNRRDVDSERVRDGGRYLKTSTWTYRDPSEWLAVPVPDAGVPAETVEKALAVIAGNVRTSRAGNRVWELTGGVAACAECGSPMRTRRRKHDNRPGHYNYYVCGRAHKGHGDCGHTKTYRAEFLEGEVVGLVDAELLRDAEALGRWMAGAEGGDRRDERDLGATERACARQIEEVARERDRLVRLYRTGRIEDAGYDGHAAELDGREAAARAELERAREEAGQRREREANRRDVLEAFGTGLSLGLGWFPPHLRQQVYGALGLRARVHPGGSVELEGSFDAEVIRLTCEVSEYAAALREAEGRLLAEERESPAAGYEATVPDPEGNLATLTVSADGERVERLERELARVRDGLTPRPLSETGRG